MCLTPINVKNKRIVGSDYAYNSVPCGKCPECRRKRANSWIFRMMQEEKIHKTSLFVTLTYDNENVPRTPRGFKTLTKRDPQLFIKRLREYEKCNTIKYYLCGEYGGETLRPHYHAIIFDATPEGVLKCWKHGYVNIGNVEEGSIAYCVKYLDKGKQIPMHDKDDRLPEFALMSKGMGKNYLTPQVVDYHRKNESFTVTLPGGIVQAMPRYYRDKIYPEIDGVKDPIRLRIKARLEQKYNALFEQRVKQHGSVFDYYRNMHEGVKACFENFKNKQKSRKL